MVKSYLGSAMAIALVLAGTPFISPSAAAPSGRIAFVRSVHGDGHIFVENSDGTKAVDVSKSSAASPAWSPDGKRIAFVSDRATGTNPQLYVMSANGANQRRLTRDAMPEGHPSWSPDGTRIAFSGENGIFVIVVKTGKTERLTNGADEEPAWSPTARMIVFVRSKDVPDSSSSTGSAQESDLWVMAADGSQPKQLTSPPLSFSDPTVTIQGADTAPAWSPDATKIAFESNRDNNNGIFVMNADGSNIEALTHPTGIDAFPTWSPDGAHIAFARTGARVLTGNAQVFTMHTDGSNQVALGSANATSPAWQPAR